MIEVAAPQIGTQHVDLVHLNRGGPLIRERALVGSIPLYESEPAALANAQMAVIGEKRLHIDHVDALALERILR